MKRLFAARWQPSGDPERSRGESLEAFLLYSCPCAAMNLNRTQVVGMLVLLALLLLATLIRYWRVLLP